VQGGEATPVNLSLTSSTFLFSRGRQRPWEEGWVWENQKASETSFLAVILKQLCPF
jgi:hypothetical protein